MSMIKKLILPLLPLLFLAKPAFADMDAARAAHERGEYETAFNEFEAESKTGNTEAMVMLGLYYAEGHHVKKNQNKSNEWMLTAADLGDPIAMRNMAMGYKFGVGNLRKDEKKAFGWFMKAAELGDTEAEFDVALAYHYGIGANLNYIQAREWYIKAAEKNHDRAQYNLSAMYAGGIGVDKNQPEADKWLKMAAENNNHEALFTLGLINHQGRDAPQNFGVAADYFKRAFIAGKADAAGFLSEYAYSGTGMDKDLVRAMMWAKLGTEISSNIPGGQLSQQMYARLNQNKSFLEGSLDNNQKREAQARMDTFMKENLGTTQ